MRFAVTSLVLLLAACGSDAVHDDGDSGSPGTPPHANAGDSGGGPGAQTDGGDAAAPPGVDAQGDDAAAPDDAPAPPPPKPATITTIAGDNGNSGGFADGTGASAVFNAP